MIPSLLKTFLQKNASTMVSMVLLVALPLLGSSSATYMLYRNQSLLTDLSLGPAFLYFAVTALTMAFALTPTTFVALVTGFYFGWAGLPGMVAAYALAALIGYQVASALDHGKMTAFLSHFPKADAVMKELKHDSWQLIVLTRISPVLPFALMTFVLAVLRVERRRFLAASVLGMLPRSLFFYGLGSKAQDAAALLRNPDTGTAGKVLLFALVVISLYGLYYLFNRALQRALRRSTPPVI
ncbi:VTT domain-containing protein (plasmid) [Hymenobacter sp. NBH84]|uniref:TVP38/TMEM64 family protein n=1 Tax=Hymenobacter sp. NBH84 TaxID=2596915 RepID=UPI00162A04DD|nr:VTT domain-containing protein [Hymenobacter sp. NBH84]QNE42237.1 VTT domain-containing protein [Hymenobacter sp. NBH84]